MTELHTGLGRGGYPTLQPVSPVRQSQAVPDLMLGHREEVQATALGRPHRHIGRPVLVFVKMDVATKIPFDLTG